MELMPHMQSIKHVSKQRGKEKQELKAQQKVGEERLLTLKWKIKK